MALLPTGVSGAMAVEDFVATGIRHPLVMMRAENANTVGSSPISVLNEVVLPTSACATAENPRAARSEAK
jgi:hypothetical protein